ncbi:MAG: hypothetical protein NWE95_08965 [Candidatus Bathyarchaeota archaeon]|nr:hypothetical protein [Candidatus Bathyarchaeota archaeon]
MTKLSESHERALSSSLYIIEDNLQRIKALLKQTGENEQTITYRRVGKISPESKCKALEAIVEMLNEIKQIKETFELETEKINLRAEISAALDEVWIILVDLAPDRLKAYGELSETEKALIASYASSLADKLKKIQESL